MRFKYIVRRIFYCVNYLDRNKRIMCHTYIHEEDSD